MFSAGRDKRNRFFKNNIDIAKVGSFHGDIFYAIYASFKNYPSGAPERKGTLS